MLKKHKNICGSTGVFNKDGSRGGTTHFMETCLGLQVNPIISAPVSPEVKTGFKEKKKKKFGKYNILQIVAEYSGQFYLFKYLNNKFVINTAYFESKH